MDLRRNPIDLRFVAAAVGVVIVVGLALLVSIGVFPNQSTRTDGAKSITLTPAGGKPAAQQANAGEGTTSEPNLAGQTEALGFWRTAILDPGRVFSWNAKMLWVQFGEDRVEAEYEVRDTGRYYYTHVQIKSISGPTLEYAEVSPSAVPTDAKKTARLSPANTASGVQWRGRFDISYSVRKRVRHEDEAHRDWLSFRWKDSRDSVTCELKNNQWKCEFYPNYDPRYLLLDFTGTD